MFISDIKDNYDAYGLPYEFAECLPEFCETCGAPLEMRESLTGLTCSNSRCPDKIVMRIKAICGDLGILYFGEAKIREFINYYGVTNPLNVLALKSGMLVSDTTSEEMSEKIISQIEKKKSFLLWEYVMIANLPYVRTSAQKIFGGYNSLEEAYADIETGGVDFIQEKLGINSDVEVSVQAMKIYQSLMEYKEDLMECLVDVNIVSLEGKKEFNVVCSDQVGGGFGTKKEFYDYVNSTFADKLHVNFLPSVRQDIDYLVWAGADGSPARYTSKVRTVEGWNSKGKTDIPIVTAQQFIEAMEDLSS